ncbi:MAG TPA: phosphoglycolate phosphatase [Methylomirabilota bacterium]|nr:phosphoglycolate phosphatase [Methylomirabilota bacterium]
MPAPLLVFDLDGTLLDTAPDLLGALNAVLHEDGLPPADRATLARRFGHGAKALIVEAYRHAGQTGIDDRVERLTERFLIHYTSRIAAETRPFPGAVAAMDRLAALGVRFAVCTNKREGMAVPLLEALGLMHRFDAVLGGDSLPVRKPDPGHLLGAIAAAGGIPSASVLVGDSDADVLAARAAGVPVVGVTFGYSPDPMEQLNPSAVIDRFDDLDAALAAVSPAFAAVLAGPQKAAIAAS